jgi:hypothetical protein
VVFDVDLKHGRYSVRLHRGRSGDGLRTRFMVADTRAASKWDARQRRLRASHELALLHVLDVSADLFDGSAVLVTHRCRSVGGLRTAVRPEVGSADAGDRQADDSVGRLQDSCVVAFLESNVVRIVQHGCFHCSVLLR